MSTTEHPARTRSPWIALLVLSAAFGLVQLDASIVTVALEAIRGALGGDVGAQQWVVDGYTVALAAGMLTAGAAGDRLGHRRMCVAGFALFGAASVGCATAGSVEVLVAFRVVQGVGAAALLPASLALIGALFPDPAARARALGVWGGIAGVGFAVGPLAGGLLVGALDWRAIFWINVPLCLVIGGLVQVLAAGTDRSAARDGRRVDVVGAVLGTAALAVATAAIIHLGEAGASVPSRIGSVVLAVLLGAGFVVSQRRASAPMLPPALFGAPAFRWITAVGFGFNFCLYGVLLAVTLVLQAGFGATPLGAGLAVLPLTAVVLAGATTSGFVAARFGPRIPMVAGFTAGAAGAVVVLAGGVFGSPATVITGLAVMGLCSLAMPAMTSVALATAPASVHGLASGVLNTSRQMGGAIGVAALGAVLATSGVDAAGLAAAVALAVVGYLVTLACAVRSTRTRAAGIDRHGTAARPTTP